MLMFQNTLIPSLKSLSQLTFLFKLNATMNDQDIQRRSSERNI